MDFRRLLAVSALACPILASLVLVSPASAQSWEAVTYYAGVSAGQTTIDTGISSLTGTAELNEEEGGFKVFGGARFNDYLAVEAFYTQFGDAILKGNNGDTFVYAGTTYTFTADGVDLTVQGSSLGIAPMAGYYVTEWLWPFVKVGVHHWQIEADVSSSAGNVSVKDDGTEFMYGAGFLVNVYEDLSVRGEYEVYAGDVEFLSGGVQLKF